MQILSVNENLKKQRVPLLFHFLKCLEFLLFQPTRSKRFSDDE